MTLDKCVQRLRRRIATEEIDAQTRAYRESLHHSSHTNGGGVHTQPPPNGTAGVPSKRGKIDRTPSFFSERCHPSHTTSDTRYTQRAIVNLSGLSVSDPHPLVPSPTLTICPPPPFPSPP